MMAVDSNVLIFESIKEEFVKNKNIRFATFKGFANLITDILKQRGIDHHVEGYDKETCSRHNTSFFYLFLKKNQ